MFRCFLEEQKGEDSTSKKKTTKYKTHSSESLPLQHSDLHVPVKHETSASHILASIISWATESHAKKAGNLASHKPSSGSKFTIALFALQLNPKI